MGKAKVSTILNLARDYKISNDERALFDFLIVKQEDFGLAKPFTHSIQQIFEATHISKHMQNKIIKSFSDLGILIVSKEYVKGNPFRSFYVDFGKLALPNVLNVIIKPETLTFDCYSEWIAELAKEQAKKVKPLSKAKQRQMDLEAAKAKENSKRIYDALCQRWKQRIEMFNDGELSGRKPKRGKSYTALPKNRHIMDMLSKLFLFYNSETTIVNAFTAYADSVLEEKINPDNMLAYFLTNENGDYTVVNSYLNTFIATYTHKI